MTIINVMLLPSGATHRSIVFAAAIRPCTYKSAMSG